MSLAIWTASSSVSYGMIDSTGPKISSWAMVMSLVTFGEHRGLHEVALVEALGLLGATGEELGALVDALLDVAPHPVALDAETSGPSRVSAANGSPGVKVSAASAAICSTSASFDRGTIMRVSAEQVWPELRKALPTPSAHGLREVGVVEDDVRALAAELEGDPLDGLAGQLAHALAGAGGAGERHHVDVGVGGDGLADHRAGTR